MMYGPVNFEEYNGEVKDTVMWNPMHMAVYKGHLEVVENLADQFKINILKSGAKAFATNEGDQVNEQESYIEDSIFLLQMALNKHHDKIFEYLLTRYSRFWPKSLFEEWFKNIIFDSKGFQ